MDITEKAPENDSMINRLNNNTSDYPAVVTALAFMSAKRHAIQWIEENKPMHFAKAILTAN